jgi:hypothetical protein
MGEQKCPSSDNIKPSGEVTDYPDPDEGLSPEEKAQNVSLCFMMQIMIETSMKTPQTNH